MKEKGMTVRIPERGRNQLLSCAESFQDLADIYLAKMCVDDLDEDVDRQTYLYQRKLNENRELLAEHLHEMAHIMKKVAWDSYTYNSLGEKKYKQVFQCLKDEKIMLKDIYYIENEKKRIEIGITMCTRKGISYTLKEVADMLSVLFDVRLIPTSQGYYLVDDVFRTYTFSEESRYTTLCGIAKAIKETEVISGDNYSILQKSNEKTTIILSDGMGSGEKASGDSEMVVDLLEKLLDAGFSKENAIQMLNSVLIIKGEEQNMSTLDICEIDLYSGACSVTKVGAANTFLKRGHLVEPLSAHNLPLGIFKRTEAEHAERKLMDGDYVIMLTDGVIEGVAENAGEDTIAEIISRIDYLNPGEIANAILNYVLHISKGRVKDDMTIVVIGLWENIKDER